GAKSSLRIVMMCSPGVNAMVEKVLPTYWPSISTSAPEGRDQNSTMTCGGAAETTAGADGVTAGNCMSAAPPGCKLSVAVRLRCAESTGPQFAETCDEASAGFIPEAGRGAGAGDCARLIAGVAAVTEGTVVDVELAIVSELTWGEPL